MLKTANRKHSRHKLGEKRSSAILVSKNCVTMRRVMIFRYMARYGKPVTLDLPLPLYRFIRKRMHLNLNHCFGRRGIDVAVCT